MAKAGTGKPAKRTRAEKKADRATKRQSRRDTWRAMRQAFTLTRQNDSRFIPYLVIFGVGAAAVVYGISYLVTRSPWFGIPVAVAAGLLAAMFTFSRRAQRSMYSRAEGTRGAAVWLLQNQVRGDWRTTPSVVGTAQLDTVHRVVGRPGVVLIGEGAPNRVRGLLAQEKKKVARVVPDTPIYAIVVSAEGGDVALGGLAKYLYKLPRNLTKEQVGTLERRLQALSSGRPPLPQGPMPTGAKMRSVQRTVRRRS
jgi:hypothetical protein